MVGTTKLRISERREINEDRSVGKRCVQPDGNLDGQSRLAHAAWSSQRQQADIVVLQSGPQRRDL